jgi:hypothetical protein
MQQVQVTFTGSSIQEIQAQAIAFAGASDRTTTGVTSAYPAPIAKTSAKARKAKAAPVVEEDAEDVSETEMEFVDDTEESDDAEVEAEETEEDADEATTLADVQNALKAFAARGTKYKDKAMSVLKKLGVKHVNELKPKQFDAVIKALK